MKTLLLLFSFSTVLHAQQVEISDSVFENILIYKGIDTDNQVNGQLSLSDAQNATTLNLSSGHPYEYYLIQNLQGIEQFSNLNTLTISGTQIPDASIDFSAFPSLSQLTFLSNGFSEIDLSSNVALTSVWIGNASADLGNHNTISKLDLSNNPNITNINAYNLFSLNTINLRNNTSPNVNIVLGNETNFPYSVCVEVDNAANALANGYPYNTWDITGNYFYSENCLLSTQNFVNQSFKIFPNPANDFIYIETDNLSDNDIQSVQILDSSGKLVKNFTAQFNQLDIQALSTGNYLLIINTRLGNKVEKFVIE